MGSRGLARCYRVGEGAAARAASDVLPTTIVLEDDGTAVAEYEHMPLLRFATLEELIQRFALEPADLVEDHAESGLTSADRVPSVTSATRVRSE